ncbi:hypothetical protein NFHSH190041_11380 [Shewanella sp. NFH-SH190041]|uniref:DksA/TraR family C4-type zinc finger protein n=1 Tax=Shewanella sp. NFH-SH190041 TaxID=2950245 RepID=UPI0021C3A5DC|nr:DksA/TraR family C4-type zinc finger protein [Shewanella sp. NFH-SH190041]BDM63686.1 hypothetical protein NFHSH190041_11380 [Shewanella sp. NFH-SH190041]
MASGWAKDGAVQEQIDSDIDDAVLQARSRLPQGESLSHCLECDEPIPVARQLAIGGVKLCVACQQEADQHQMRHALMNRRGSKDSQLR